MWASLSLVIVAFDPKSAAPIGGEREVAIDINLNYVVSIRRADDDLTTHIRVNGVWNGDNLIYIVRETPEQIWAASREVSALSEGRRARINADWKSKVKGTASRRKKK